MHATICSPDDAITATHELPVCVLGMHRSGTSLTARILNLLGVDLGPEKGLIGSGPHNEKGYWEQRAIFNLNETVLAAMGGDWATPPPLPPGWERAPELEPLRQRARHLLEDYFGESRLWGFKDPRISLTLPFWRELVPRMRYVICVRNPEEVRESFARYSDGGELAHRDWDGLWLLSIVSALVHTSDSPRLLIRYEDYFGDLRGEAERLARFVERPLTPKVLAAAEQFVERDLRHHRFSARDFLADESRPAALRTLYAAVCELPHDSSAAQVDTLERLATGLPIEGIVGPDPLETAPTVIAEVPADLEKPGVRRFGITSDGWLERDAFAMLAGGPDATLLLRALVLEAPDQHLELTVNGTTVASLVPDPGLLELRMPVVPTEGPRCINATWHTLVPLSDGDKREAAARLELLALVPCEAPKELAAFPDDLALPDLAPSGVFDDGWLADSCGFTLAAGAEATLRLRGQVPQEAAGQQLDVLVQGHVRLSSAVRTGAFEATVPLEASPTRRRIEMRWRVTVPLKPPDNREAAALLTFAGLT